MQRDAYGNPVLYLGGMRLVDHKGDVDITIRGERFAPSIRLQRADMDEIIKFLQQAKRNAR